MAAGDHDFDFDDHHHRRRSQRALRAIVAITIVLTSIGLPADAVLLLLGVDAFFDMGRTALNVYGSTAAAAVAVRLSGSEDGIAADTVTRQASV